MSETRSVLFVCLGNICHSPAAEAILRQIAVDRGLDDQIHIDSAGTIRYHNGSPADPRMLDAAAYRGYELTSISRVMTPDDFDRFDLIIAMDGDNLYDIQELAENEHDAEKMKLFSDFLPEDFPRDIPDPFLGEAGFDQVLDIIEEGCPAILDALFPEERPLEERLLEESGHGGRVVA